MTEAQSNEAEATALLVLTSGTVKGQLVKRTDCS
jgi:hypothetical protein